MRKSFFLFVLTMLFLSGCATCCDKKVKGLENRIATLESTAGSGAMREEPKEQQAETPVLSSIETQAITTSLEVPMIESPTKSEIQAALKNAGFYNGEVDGKLGPKTKKAIEDFQSANSLTVDGKVGTKTWNKLKYYLKASKESSASH